jgi:hypothetical protein
MRKISADRLRFAESNALICIPAYFVQVRRTISFCIRDDLPSARCGNFERETRFQIRLIEAWKTVLASDGTKSV